MDSLHTSSPPLKSRTIFLDIDNNFGICWEQNRLQMAFESPPWEQEPLSAGTWDADESSASEYFAQDAVLAYGLSDILLADPSLSTTGLEEYSSNPGCSADAEHPLLDSSPLPTDNDTPERPAREGSRRPARPDVSLRTASKKPKRPARHRRPVGPSMEARAREGHNMVEKQYRSRLKAQFEALLAVLPVAKSSHHSGVNPGQCLSRGEVLDAAREAILRQENEIGILTARREKLEKDLATLEQVLQRRRM